MKWYLNSASGNLLHKSRFFTRKLKEHNCSNMLIIAHQSSKGADRALGIIKEQEPSISNTAKLKLFSPQDYLKGHYKITDFDSLYIKGGTPDKWDAEILSKAGPDFDDDLKKFLMKPNGCFFGSSLGLMILFEKFHAYNEQGEEHLSYWYDHGLGIYKNILPETHYSPPQDMEFLKTRHLQTLKEHKDFNFGVMFSVDCVIEVDSKDIMNWKILSGRYEVNKYYPEL